MNERRKKEAFLLLLRYFIVTTSTGAVTALFYSDQLITGAGFHFTYHSSKATTLQPVNSFSLQTIVQDCAMDTDNALIQPAYVTEDGQETAALLLIVLITVFLMEHV